MKRKNRAVAKISGFFGPLGTLYFGWKVALANLVCYIVVVLIAILAIRAEIPSWFQYLTSAFYMVWAFTYTSVHNAIADGTDTEKRRDEFFLITIWAYALVVCIGTGIYTCYGLFHAGRYVRGLLYLCIGIPLEIWVVNMCLMFVFVGIGTALGIYSSKSSKSRQTNPETCAEKVAAR